MFHCKKTAVWISAGVVAIVVVACLILLISRPAEKTAESLPEQRAAPVPISEAVNTPPETVSELPPAAPQTSYDRVTIEYLSENKGFKTTNTVEITDPGTVARIDNALRDSMTHADETDLKNNHTNEYTIKLSNETGGYSAGLYYDTLYNKAYIVNNGSLFETGTDFARYIDSFFENTNSQ